MPIIGSADVAIRADGTGFDAQVKRIISGSSGTFARGGDEAASSWMGGFSNRLRAANGDSMMSSMLSSMEQTVNRSATRIGSSLSTGIQRGYDSNSGGIEQSLRQTTDRLERSAGGSGNRIGRGLSRGLSGAFTGDFANKARAAADAFQTLWTKAAFGAPVISSLIGTISSLVGGLGALGSAAASAAGSLGGILPVIGTMIQAGGTLAIAFQGVGKAIGAGMKNATATTGPTRKAIKAVKTDTTSAMRAIQDARQRVADTARQNSQRMADATRKVTDAEGDLLDSQKALTVAQRGLTAARKAGREELQQLAFDTEDAALAEQRAQLNLEDAYDALVKVQNLPADNRTRREAELSFKEAELNYRQAKDRASDTADAQQEAAKKGIAGTKAYTDAQKDVIAAQNDINAAEQKLADARADRRQQAADNARDMAQAQLNLKRQYQDLARINAENARRAREAAAANAASSTAATSAANAYADAMSKLSPAAQDFVRKIIGMRDEFNQFKKDIQEPFFIRFNRAFDQVLTLFRANKDGVNVFKDALVETAKILGTFAEQFAGALVRNAGSLGQVLAFNNSILKIFTERTKTGHSAISNLVTIFFRLYRAFEPLATQFAVFIRNLTTMAVKATDGEKGMGRLADFVERAGRRMSGFADIAGSMIKILLGIAEAAGPAADTILKYFQDSFDGIEKAVGKNQAGLREFFNTSVSNLMPLLDLVGKLALALLKVGNNDSLAKAFKILEGGIEPLVKILDSGSAAAPALATLAVSVLKLVAAFAESESLEIFFNLLTKVVDTISKMLESPMGQAILKWIGPILAVLHAVGLIRKAFAFIANVAIGNLIKAFGPLLAAASGFASRIRSGGSVGQAAGAGARAGGGAVRQNLVGGAAGKGGDGGINAFIINLERLRVQFLKVSVAKDAFIVNLSRLRASFAAPLAGGANRPLVGAAAASAPVNRSAPGVIAGPMPGGGAAGGLKETNAALGETAKRGSKIGGIFKGIGGAMMGGFSMLLGALPIIIMLVSLLLPVFQKLYDTNKSFKGAIDGMVGAFTKLGSTVMSALAPILETVMGLIASLVTKLGPVLETVVGFIGSVFSALVPIVTTVINAIMPIVSLLADQFLSVLIPVIKMVIGVFNQVLAAVLPPLIQIVQVVVSSLMPVFKALAPIFQQVFGVLGEVIGQLAEVFGVLFGQIIQVLVGTVLPVIMELIPVFVEVFTTIATVVGQLVAVLVPAFSLIVRTLISVVMPIIEQFGTIFIMIINQVMITIRQLMPLFVLVFNTIIQTIMQLIPVLLPVIMELVGLFAQVLMPTVKALMPVFILVINTILDLIRQLLPVLVPVITTIVQLFLQLVTALLPIITQLVNLFVAILVPAIRLLVPVITFVLGVFIKILQVALPIITMIIVGLVRLMVKILIPAIRAIVPVVQYMANMLIGSIRLAFNFVSWIWNNVLRPIIAAIKTAITSVGTVSNQFKTTFTAAIKTAFSYFQSAYNSYIKPTLTAFSTAMGKLGEWSRNARDSVGHAFSGLVDKIKGPVKTAIKWINDHLIDKLNTVTSKFGLKITRISENFAEGGQVTGPGGPTDDKVPINASDGEFVMKTRSSKKIGYQALMYMNETGELPHLKPEGDWISAGWAKLTAAAKNLADSGIKKTIDAFWNKTIGPWVSSMSRGGNSYMNRLIGGIIGHLKPKVSTWATARDTEADRIKKKYEAAQAAKAAAAAGGGGSGVPRGSVNNPSGKVRAGNGQFTNLFAANLNKAEKIASARIRIFQAGWRPSTSYSGTSHRGDAIDLQVNNALIRALRRVGIAAGDRTGLGNWVGHVHAIPGPRSGYPRGSAIWQWGDYKRRGGASQGLRSPWGLAEGGTVYARPGGVMALVGEGGRNERVEPLDSRGISERDKAVIREMMLGMGGGLGGGNVVVRVYIGDTELKDIVDYQIDSSNIQMSNMIRTGRRRG